MKRRYREAMRAQLRLQDAYIDGLTDDEEALEAQQWRDENVPQCEASEPDHHLDEQLPF